MILLIFISVFTLNGCTQRTKKVDFSDDYVLVEFAARLEEDYQKLYPQPLDQKPTSPTEENL